MKSSSEKLREKLRIFFDNPSYHALLATLIILSIFSIGYELSVPPPEKIFSLVRLLNKAIVLIFGIEVLIKILIYRREFFKDPWHVFDFIVVFVSLILFGGYFQSLRIFRLFGLLRLFSIFPHFKHVIDAIGKSLSQIISIIVLMGMMVYFFSLVGVIFFGKDHPHSYGTVGRGMKGIFNSVMMPHTWSEHLGELSKTTPYAGIFIISMIIILNFFLLQFIIGVIVSALMRQEDEEQREKNYHFFMKWLRKAPTVKEEKEHISSETLMIIHKIEELSREMKELKNSHLLHKDSCL